MPGDGAHRDDVEYDRLRELPRCDWLLDALRELARDLCDDTNLKSWDSLLRLRGRNALRDLEDSRDVRACGRNWRLKMPVVVAFCAASYRRHRSMASCTVRAHAYYTSRR